MSHGKETPRQKMINLMYLVLTCLLALNVSREVLFGFVSINERLEKSNSDFEKSAALVMESAQKAVEQGHQEVKPYILQATKVTRIATRANRYIDSLKKQIIVFTESKDGADTLLLAESEQLENTDKPANMLLGDDAALPKKGMYTANHLKQQITEMCDSLLYILESTKATKGTYLPEADFLLMKQQVNELRPLDTYKNSDGEQISWELKEFYNLPLAAVITQLSRLQTEIQQLHTNVLSTLVAAAGKLSISFDSMEANVVPQKKYVQLGENYSASVFLGASSSKFSEDNLQFVLGDVDTSSGQLAPNAIVLPAKNGFAELNLPGSSLGHKQITGWVRLREGTGDYKYFRYQSDFQVAPSSIAVSADKMNLFYAGVENPLSVSAAGVAPEDLEVKIIGAGSQISNLGNGKYSVKINGSGTSTVSVFQKTEKGLKLQGQPKVFRTKKLPDPVLKVAGKTIQFNADFSLAEARNMSFIGLDLSGIEFAAPFRISSFEVITAGGGSGLQFFKSENGSFDAPTLSAFRKLKKGSFVIIENIMVNAPEGLRKIAPVKIIVK